MMGIASRMPRMPRTTRRGFYQGIGLFCVQVRKRNGTVVHMMENGTVQPTKMVQQFKETGHPIFTATSAFESRNVETKARQKYHSLQWRRHERRTIFRTINSVNQVSIYAAVTNWCYNFALKK